MSQKSVATIGNFDGLHLGHRALVNRVLELAKKRHCLSVVLTFDPHPVKVLFPEKGLKQIFDLEDRLRCLTELGVGRIVVMPFSRELSQLSPESFFNQVVLQDLRCEILVIGHDFSFGKDRAGTLDVLKRLGNQSGVEVIVEPPVMLDGKVVSSSGVRRAVSNGNMELAKRLLGRPFYMKGVVVKGAGRGKKIGFPTANLFTQSDLYPKGGVYVTEAVVKGQLFQSVTNAGTNPTFTSGHQVPVQIETHILDFNEDIYGEKIEVRFHQFIRDEKKFSSVEELIKQIALDSSQARGATFK
ncbi:MAG: bifunctional riboflavin kinase/FAD synthetase [Oligoflexia bacterium]|nr:bifunctional riboflavin kinase/FAD synthetase [Oligoflexia bacterium]